MRYKHFFNFNKPSLSRVYRVLNNYLSQNLRLYLRASVGSFKASMGYKYFNELIKPHCITFQSSTKIARSM